MEMTESLGRRGQKDPKVSLAIGVIGATEVLEDPKDHRVQKDSPVKMVKRE